MATAPSQLMWEVVKGHNSVLRKNLNGSVFSAEPGNLYNKHSYKYSGEQLLGVGKPLCCSRFLRCLVTTSQVLAETKHVVAERPFQTTHNTFRT